MKIFKFILGIGYTFMAGLCIWGLYSLIEESTNISEDVLYIILFVGVAFLLGFAAICSFKQSMTEDSLTSAEDIPVKDMLIQRKNNNENNVLTSTIIDELKKK